VDKGGQRWTKKNLSSQSDVFLPFLKGGGQEGGQGGGKVGRGGRTGQHTYRCCPLVHSVLRGVLTACHWTSGDIELDMRKGRL
jgi:hypothetical protein